MFIHNGKPYARVSDAIKPFANFQGIPEKVLNNKALLGTNVHNAIDEEIKGNFPVVEVNESGYVQSFKKWWDEMKPVVVKTEMRYYCDKKMLTGCIDALIKIQGEEKAVLVDWKTSAVESAETWPMQAHLYGYLLKENGIEIGDRYLFIKLDKNGKLPRVFQYSFNPNILAKSLQAVDDFWLIQEKSVVDNL